MKKRLKILTFLFLSFILISSLAFVSAGFFSNLFNKNKITGKVVAICTDTDGGQNYSKKGSVIFNGENVFEDYCFNDVFSTDIELMEGICYEGAWGKLYYQCPNGCKDGACTENEPACVDSDGGYNIYVKGELKWKSDSGEILINKDYCSGVLITEYGCKEGKSYSEVYTCPYGCYNGACTEDNSSTGDLTPRIMYWYGKVNQHIDINTGRWMTDPNGVSGANIDKLTYCKKWYPNTVSIKEYKMETINTWRDKGNTGGPYTSTKQSYECVQEITSKCAETDGGINYYVKGNVLDIVHNANYWDSCIVPNNPDNVLGGGWTPVSQGDYVVEYYCGENNYQYTAYKCSDGCSDGACILTPSNATPYYPAPFIVNGIADVAIIYGTQSITSALEIVQAGNIQDDLQSRTPTIALGDMLIGDSKLDSVRDKSWIVVGTPCSNSAIWTSLRLNDCSYVAPKLGINPGQFAFHMTTGTNGNPVLLVIGYTPEDVVNAVRYLISNPVATFIGSTYVSPVVQSVSSCTDTDGGINYNKKGMLDIAGLLTATIDETQTITLNGKSVSIEYISADNVKFKVNDEITNTLTKGDFYLLKDGSYIIIKDIMFSSKDSVVSSAIFSIQPGSAASQFTDSCLNPAILTEFYCGENGEPQNLTRDCGMENKICSEGACVQETTSDCAETDGGINYYIKGNVAGRCYCTEEEEGVCTSDFCYENKTIWEDYCAGTSDNSVIEYYCDGGVQNVIRYPCPNGCKDGACIKPVGKSCLVDATNCNLEWKIPVCGLTVPSADGLSELCEIPGIATGSISADFKFNQPYSCANVSLCPNGCYNGVCVVGCVVNADCPEGERCASGICLQKVQTTQNCDSGCVLNNKCYPFGYRRSGTYCSENSQFTNQIQNDGVCENNFECRSNLCVDSQCINQGIMRRFLNWFKSFGRRNK